MRKGRLNLFYVINEIYLRLVEMFGVFVSFIAFMTFFSLFSYCAEDRSLNTAIDGIVSNIVSLPGSYYADVMRQAFGTSSYVFSLLLLACGYQLIKYHSVVFWRFLLGILALPMLDAALALGRSSIGYAGFVGAIIVRVLKLDTLAHSDKIILISMLSLLGIAFIFLSLKIDFSVFKGKAEDFRGISIGNSFKKMKELELFNSDRSNDDDFEPVLDNEVGELGEINEEMDIDEINDISEPQLEVPKISKIVKKVKPKRNAEKVVLPVKTSAVFRKPEMDLLSVPKEKEKGISESELKNHAGNLLTVLNDFGIKGEVTGVKPGPVVTLYELKPAAGIKSSRVIGLSSDIARYMSAVSARVAVIPGRNALGIELPNEKRQIVYLREILESNMYKRSAAALPIALGKNIGGEPVVADLAKMPHLLVAGTTGSGKSVGINAMIISLLYRLSPDECKFIMVDPKMLELSVYNDIPHLLTPVVTDPKKAVVALKWAVHEMESRYVNMSKLGVRNIEGYNSKLASMQKSGETLTRHVNTGFDPETGAPIYETQTVKLEPIPYIVIIVDEMADLMLVAGKEIEIAVQRLAQMARAAGIHLIMATQRPSVDVITGTIKANFPTRISFQVSSKIDSRTILGEQGAEQLLGQGDMLYMASGGRTLRIHCPFVSDEEVEKVTSCLKAQGEPHYIDDILTDDGEDSSSGSSGDDSSDDPMYKEAVDLVMRDGKVSTSFLQRRLKIGYNRAARIVDMMEEAGIVSPANHVGKREILGK